MNIQLSNKKEAIFKSTLELIGEQGFHGAPMSQIAKHAGVATGTIYHYFPSKDQLIYDLFIDCKVRLMNHIFDYKEDLSFKEQFFLVFKRLVDFFVEEKDIFGFVDQFYSSPYYQTVKDCAHHGNLAMSEIREFFQKGVQLGILRSINVYTLVSAYFGVAISFIKNILYGYQKFEDQDLNDLVEIIWNGVKNTKHEV